MISITHPAVNHRTDLFSRLALVEGFGEIGRPGLPYFDSVGKSGFEVASFQKGNEIGGKKRGREYFIITRPPATLAEG